MLKTIAVTTALLGATALASAAQAKIGDVFVIAMENQNSTVAGANASGLNPIYGNPAAPYINSLITPGNPNAALTSYSSAYHDVVVNSTTDLHPSEPNYIYQISGLDSEPLTDNVPSTGNQNLFPVGTPNLGSSLTNAGMTWKSYQEDTQIPGVNVNTNASGTNGPVNPYNGSTQYNYAAKHDPFVFFAGDQANASNTAPLTSLQSDLNNNTVANFNWITPDQYNDMHTSLNGGFTYDGTHFTGNQANIAQGDNFLSIVVPEIEASQAFKDNGLIVIWTDEDEGDTPSTNSQYSNMEILIGHDTKGNAFTDFVPMNHNSDLKTYLQLYGLSGSGYPSAVTGSNSLSSLLKPGAVPEPATWAMMLVGFGVVGGAMRRRVRVVAA
jgi:hypothetical protein